MIRSMYAFALLIALGLAGCVTTRQKTEYGDVRVGDIYELRDGATIIRCEQFTFWGLPGTGNTDCLLPRGGARRKGAIATGDLSGPIKIRVYKIKDINAIDYWEQIVYIQVIPGGKKYVAGQDALKTRISRAPSAKK